MSILQNVVMSLLGFISGVACTALFFVLRR